MTGDPVSHNHLIAACQLATRNGGQVVALVIGLVPPSLPMGSSMPERWSRLEYEAARARRIGREMGVAVESVLVLSDSAGEAVVQLAEESDSDAVCLAHEPGLSAAVRRWLDPFWRIVLDHSPRPVVLERLRSPATLPATGAERSGVPPLASER